MELNWTIVVAAYAAVSLVTFLAYGWDKWRAGRGARRTPERTLHLLELLGGWPGAWIGQRTFRHKTRKRSFRVVFFAIVALHAVLWGAWAWFTYR